MDWYEISEVNFDKNEYICSELFEVWFLDFSLKQETMKNTHNWNVAELLHRIIVLSTQELGISFFDNGILVW